jgi:hypothetical protein
MEGMAAADMNLNVHIELCCITRWLLVLCVWQAEPQLAPTSSMAYLLLICLCHIDLALPEALTLQH